MVETRPTRRWSKALKSATGDAPHSFAIRRDLVRGVARVQYGKQTLRNEPMFACDVRRLSVRAVQTERLWVMPEVMGSVLPILGEKSNPSGITQRGTCEAVGPGGNTSEVRTLVKCGWLRLAARNTSQGHTAMCVAAPAGRERKQRGEADMLARAGVKASVEAVSAGCEGRAFARREAHGWLAVPRGR